jgi:hypothetical protein
MLAGPLQSMWTFRSTKKGKLSMEQKAMGELIKSPGHAWLRVRPNT